VQLPDPEIGPVHLRFKRCGEEWQVQDEGCLGGSHLGTGRLQPKRAQKIQSTDAISLGPYLLEIFLDEGGGLTSNSVDTGRLARALVEEMLVGRDTIFSLWVLRGVQAGSAIPLEGLVTIGAGSDCDLVLNDPGIADLHLTLEQKGEKISLHALAAVKLRGESEKRAELVAGDLLSLGEVILQIQGPSLSPPLLRWSRLEWGVLLVAALSAGLGFLAWLSR